ncbi:MAG TPA: SUMF1/EgtB/PvdO family nonheme iron enzyme [Patescibacteria group bacterium]|nr:SUMF1/EgtB/PvdO family nonheme iron enzyme [Patescibacteria group bacterium]
MKRRLLFFIFVCALVIPGTLCANNINITNVFLTEQDSSAHTIKVQFDISWENSWRDAVNNDAAWVFVKFSTDAGVTWKHATMKKSGQNPYGFSAGIGTSVDMIVPGDLRGVFIQREENGKGTVSVQRAQLVWGYGMDGVSDADANSLETRIKLFGIEMVYIPTGSFQAGDADASLTGSFKAGLLQDVPINIGSGSALVFNNADYGPYYYRSAGQPGEFGSGATFTVPSSFPKGYDAFYLMKYEISQGQWTEFFNTLTADQKITRDITSASGKNSDQATYRNAVSWSVGDATLVNNREDDRACNYLSWMDLCAYADWAGLRPMTELEFEKACRGPQQAVKGEFAWGDTAITAADTISGTENGMETISTPGANACYNAADFQGGDGGRGPLRCGIFAATATDRRGAGAGYYGAMELTGNIWEHCVTIGNTVGLNFIGSHGDGILTDSGNATNTDWPGIDSTAAKGVTGAMGSGLRGGSWYDTDVAKLTVAGRHFAATADTNRDSRYGGRCARTAP